MDHRDPAPVARAAGSPALWPTERADRISLGTIDHRFAAAREALGLPDGLDFHSLRRSYVTHLIEDGWDPFFVQQQVGHEHASTTSIYTCVSSDFRVKTLRSALDATVTAALAKPPAPARPNRAGRTPAAQARRRRGEGGTVTRRNVSYQWRLREVMAAHGMFATTDLVPLLNDRGIELSASQVHRLVTGTPERLSLPVLAALCDIFEVTPADLIRTAAENAAPRRTATAGGQVTTRRRGGPSGRGSAQSSDRVGGPPSCRRELRAQLSELLDDGTGQVAPALTGLLENLVSMPEPTLCRNWLRNNAHARDYLRGLARGEIPLTHEALLGLPSWRTAVHLCDLLMAVGALPATDRQILLFERWYRDQIKAVDDPQHAQALRQFTTWRLLPRMRSRAAGQFLASGTRNAAAHEFTKARRYLAWLAGAAAAFRSPPRPTSTPGTPPRPTRAPCAASSSGPSPSAACPLSTSRASTAASGPRSPRAAASPWSAGS